MSLVTIILKVKLPMKKLFGTQAQAHLAGLMVRLKSVEPVL
jgi:hypothetical protein